MVCGAGSMSGVGIDKESLVTEKVWIQSERFAEPFGAWEITSNALQMTRNPEQRVRASLFDVLVDFGKVGDQVVVKGERWSYRYTRVEEPIPPKMVKGIGKQVFGPDGEEQMELATFIPFPIPGSHAPNAGPLHHGVPEFFNFHGTLGLSLTVTDVNFNGTTTFVYTLEEREEGSC